MHLKDIGRGEVIDVGRGYYKKKTTEQKKANIYGGGVGKTKSTGVASVRKYDTVLAKTKGYDALEKKTKERRGRKKKK